MKEDQKKPTAANAAPTVENLNGTENQQTAAVTTETPTEAAETPEAVTSTPPEETQAPQTEKQAPSVATETTKAETIEEFSKRLENELSRLNHKKTLAHHREKFIKSIGSLQLYIDELKNDNEFETQSGKITFNVLNTDTYNRTEYINTFSLTNTALIKKFCIVLLSEMEQKIKSLETELLTA